MKYFLAIDIGASSGRHILGHYESDGSLAIEEIHRFKNHVVKTNEGLLWDLRNLEKEVVTGMKKCYELGKIPASVAIDTFGVDYVILENGQAKGKVFSYRDERTVEAKKEFQKLVSDEEMFQINGVQPLVFNSIYQLYDDYKKGRLSPSCEIMFLPSYLMYYLTGTKSNELSIASTSGLLNSAHTNYDERVLKAIGLSSTNFAPLMACGSNLGRLRNSIVNEIGYDCQGVLCLEHDTAAAVCGAQTKDGDIFLSSGTWSLIGVILPDMISNSEALKAKFTNEMSRGNEVRFLKNIMGMWIISEVQREQKEMIPVTEIVKLAYEGADYKDIFDVTSDEFLAPKSMTQAINKYFENRGIVSPKDLSELAYCVFNSLAHGYADAVKEIEKLTKTSFKRLVIFGGGSQNLLLNDLTSRLVGKEVVRGPVEATAIGNIISQGGQ